MFEAIQYCQLMYLERNEHDPAHFPTEPVLAWQAALKKLKLELLIDMLLLVEGGIRGGICHSIHRYVKANSKSWKDYRKNKQSSYLKYCRKNYVKIF